VQWQAVVVKGAIKRLIPFKPQLRRLKRMVAGYDPVVPNLWSTIGHAEKIFADLDARNFDLRGATVLELGSGWFPVIPLLYRFKGAGRVVMTDINPYLDPVSFAAAKRFVSDNLRQITGRLGLDSEHCQTVLTETRSFDAPDFNYACPFNIHSIADGSIDVISSRTVLEHIPPADLIGLFAALRPKLSVRGLMIHLVDESDHLEHVDKSLTRINFLTMGPARWALVNWCCDYQNRLRHHEFPALFRAAGYRIDEQLSWVDESTLAIAPTLKLVPPFDAMTPEQVSTLESLFVLTPERSA
jgi:hypothetical protein